MNFEYGGLESNLFNDKLSFTWTIATLLALARRTGRSIVLPKLQHHHGVNHLWATLDLESVKELGIDYKETSFPNNPKAWHNSTTPFQSVARTALGAWNTAGAEKSMFAQFPGDDPHAEGPIQAWRFEDPITEQDAINAWWAMHTAVPEIDNAELLLVNPHFINSAHLGIVKQLKGMSKLVGVEREIADIHAKLRWCWHPTTTVSYEDIVGRSSPDYDCYGRGELYEF